MIVVQIAIKTPGGPATENVVVAHTMGQALDKYVPDPHPELRVSIAILAKEVDVATNYLHPDLAGGPG